MSMSSKEEAEDPRYITESILMKLAPADGRTLDDSIWAPKNNIKFHRSVKKLDLPAWLKEMNAKEKLASKAIVATTVPPGDKPAGDLPPHMKSIESTGIAKENLSPNIEGLKSTGTATKSLTPHTRHLGSTNTAKENLPPHMRIPESADIAKENLPPYMRISQSPDIAKESLPAHMGSPQSPDIVKESLPPHMRFLGADEGKPTATRKSRVPSDASTLSGSVLQMAIGSEEKSFDNVTKGQAAAPVVQDPNESRSQDISSTPATVDRWLNGNPNRAEEAPHAPVAGSPAASKQTPSVTPIKVASQIVNLSPVMPTGKSITAKETIEQGRLFAQNAANKYGTPKYMKPISIVRSSEVEKPLPKAKEEQETEGSIVGISKPASNSPAITISGPERIGTVPTPQNPESSAAIPALAKPLATPNLSSLKAIAAVDSQRAAGKEENREHAAFFNSWGPQLHREAPAAQKRKVFITGDPAWDTTPKADFIASIVFGGPLEQIYCAGVKAAVTFINPADAETFFNRTPNGVVYRGSLETTQYFAEVAMADDVTPVSSLVQQYVEQGFTRCIRAIGVDLDLTLEDLRALAVGKTSSRGAARKLERLEDEVNARNHRAVTFHFCDIREAVIFKAEITRNQDWEHVNLQYTADPCAEATGPRVEVCPAMKVL